MARIVYKRWGRARAPECDNATDPDRRLRLLSSMSLLSQPCPARDSPARGQGQKRNNTHWHGTPFVLCLFGGTAFQAKDIASTSRSSSAPERDRAGSDWHLPAECCPAQSVAEERGNHHEQYQAYMMAHISKPGYFGTKMIISNGI